MKTSSKSALVSWKVIAPIIADIIVSPWNLLVGGLLIQRLSFFQAVISSVLGYTILALVFYFYGGLGLQFRKNTSLLLEPVFGRKGTKVFFSGLLAAGQIGWFAIINQIGGESLSSMIHSPFYVGILLYGVAMFLMVSLSLQNLGIVKALITFSSLGLIAYLFAVHVPHLNFTGLFSLKTGKENILWGTSVVIASLISFSSVTPDFMSQLEKKRDLILTILWGLVIPGIAVTSVGAVLFFGSESLSLAPLIGLSGFALFGHVFNIITNSDAALAAFTPALRFQYIFGLPFRTALFLVTSIGVFLSLFLNVSSALEVWLKILAGVYPAIIGITLAKYALHLDVKKKQRTPVETDWRAIMIMIFTSSFIFVFQISMLHWIVGLTAFTLYTISMGVVITIYIGKEK